MNLKALFKFGFACAFIFVSLAIRGAALPGDDPNANTARAASALQRWYNHKGLWDTTDWWNAANCTEAMENSIVANNGRAHLDILSNTFKLNSAGGFLNDYYDDEGWWALAWIRAFDLTGDVEYLNMAKSIFKNMTGGWTDHCDGGIGWRKSQLSKNAIQNELFLVVAVRLHQRTSGDAGAGSYLDWALREWNWFQHSGVINSHNLVNDGLNRRCENNGRTTWTYNQGAVIGGLTDLYKTTGESNYLAQAKAIADATISTLIDEHGVLREPCETGDCHGGDVPQFKGVFIRYLAYLYDETHDVVYGDFLRRNARSIWKNDRDDADHLGLRWSGPFDSADAARHSSAMMAVSALAEPSTENLPFAKGAAGEDFEHSVGTASGTLAWTCDANTASEGIMLSGACATLPAGKHAVHFRMAVDDAKHFTNELVRLEVKEVAAETILASSQIPWISFNASGRSQDFELTFTNASADEPLEFQVYWNHVPKSTALTLSDVTVDGSHNWVAANFDHQIGRLDGMNDWEADPIRDRASGYLANSPGVTELSAGIYSACFELKVDNFNWDKSKVAIISIVDTHSGGIIASSEIRRDQFSNALYHVFTLKFKARANGAYGFRTYWFYAPNAPRLTERSVVIKN